MECSFETSVLAMYISLVVARERYKCSQGKPPLCWSNVALQTDCQQNIVVTRTWFSFFQGPSKHSDRKSLGAGKFYWDFLEKKNNYWIYILEIFPEEKIPVPGDRRSKEEEMKINKTSWGWAVPSSCSGWLASLNCWAVTWLDYFQYA